MEHLLSAEDVRTFPQDLFAHWLATLVPTIAVNAVGSVLVADVIAAYSQLLCCSAGTEQTADDQGEDFFHR